MTPSGEGPEFDADEVLAIAGASPGRRFLGLVSLAGLGLLLIYIALTQSPAPEWRLFLVVLGAVTLWLTDLMRRATASRIELTQTELRDSDGTRIALIAELDGMDRGFFAFKPSNGFLLHTKNKSGNVWRPGMWWRIGRRIGVGGMTPAHQYKKMAEIIAVILSRRELDPPP